MDTLVHKKINMECGRCRLSTNQVGVGFQMFTEERKWKGRCIIGESVQSVSATFLSFHRLFPHVFSIMSSASIQSQCVSSVSLSKSGKVAQLKDKDSKAECSDTLLMLEEEEKLPFQDSEIIPTASPWSRCPGENFLHDHHWLHQDQQDHVVHVMLHLMGFVGFKQKKDVVCEEATLCSIMRDITEKWNKCPQWKVWSFRGNKSSCRSV